MKRAQIFVILLLLLSSSLINAQILEEAKALYLKGDYVKSFELASKRLKIKPKDANTSLLVGLNAYHLGDFKTAEKTLQFAAEKSLPEAFYYLGQIQYKGYRFAESADNLSKYIAQSKADSTMKLKAEHLLPLSQAGARLIKGIENVQIIDSMVVDKKNFLRHYRLSRESGEVRSTEGFTSVYQNQRNDKMYFSMKTKKNGVDLFTRSRLMDAWGDTVALSETINTKANENFPFVLSDGVTLYYSSDGEGTMGGSDIFVTRYNLANDTYLSPENIGMPFNSIFNDYLLVIDEQNSIGWFASDRYQPKDKVVIYVFIPNETKKIVENVAAQKLIQLASIHSIRDTWIKGENYTSYFNKIGKSEADSVRRLENVSTFRWVLNDTTIYHSLGQFKSEDAKNCYFEYLKTNELLRMLQKQLDQLRSEYSTSTKEHRTELSPAILATEKQVEQLFQKQKDLELKSRRLELK